MIDNELNRALAALMQVLAAGPRPAVSVPPLVSVLAQCSKYSVRRAREILGVVVERVDGTWKWRLPPNVEAPPWLN